MGRTAVSVDKNRALPGIWALQGERVVGREHEFVADLRVGPVAYTVIAQFALNAAWKTPWIWPAQPPHNLDAILCAAIVFAAGIIAALRGPRESAHE